MILFGGEVCIAKIEKVRVLAVTQTLMPHLEFQVLLVLGQPKPLANTVCSTEQQYWSPTLTFPIVLLVRCDNVGAVRHADHEILLYPA
jgi:hypothetical protein